MLLTQADNLACPIDGLKLNRSSKQLTCENGHNYDIAKQGYVNLLPVQHKRSKQPGDSKIMVLARSHFLDTEIYRPIADKINETVLAQLPDEQAICILDAGCGEGYYSDALIKSLAATKKDSNIAFVGLDISKEAIIQASKRNKQISWLVGTNRQPPLEKNSVDIILCMFGFISAAGFEKVLKPGGKIILIDPGSDHLKELREIIYPEIKTNTQTSEQTTELPGFTRIEKQSLNFNVMIADRSQINNLLLMTPHFYRASKEGKEAASSLETLATTVDVVFTILEKTS